MVKRASEHIQVLLPETYDQILDILEGVLRHPSPLLRAALVGRVREAAPAVRAIQSRFEPAVGAVLLALDLARIETNAALLSRLERMLPGAGFFATG